MKFENLKEDVEKLMNDCISSLSQATLDKDFVAVRAIGECIGRVNTLLKKICDVDSIEKAFETGVETQNLVDFILINAPVFNRYRIDFRCFVKERMSEVSTREKPAPGPRIERKKRSPDDILKVYEEVVPDRVYVVQAHHHTVCLGGHIPDSRRRVPDSSGKACHLGG